MFLPTSVFGDEISDHYYEDGMKLYEADDYRGAVEKFKLALEHDPKQANIYTYIGKAYLNLNQLDDAKRFLEAALKIDKDSVTAQIGIADIKVLSGQCDSAIPELETLKAKAVSKREQSTIYGGLAICYEAIDKYKAIQAINDLIATDNRDSMPANNYAVLSRLYSGTGQSTKSLSAIKKALELNDAVEYRVMFANALFIIGQFKESIAEYNKLIQNNPNNAKYHSLLAEVLQLSGDIEQGLKELSTAIDLEPTNADYYYQKAKVQFLKEDYEESIKSAKYALEYGNNVNIKAVSQFLIGDCLYNQGKIEEAIKKYEQLIKNYPEARNAKFVGSMVDSIKKNKEGKSVILKSIPFFFRLGENHSLSACLKTYLKACESDLSDAEINSIAFDDRIESYADVWLLLKSKDFDAILLPSDLDYIKTQLNVGVPLITKVNVDNSPHYVIIKGYDDRKQIFYVIDPRHNNTVENIAYSEWQVVDYSLLFVVPSSELKDEILKETNANRKIAIEKTIMVRESKNYPIIAAEPDGLKVAENILQLNPRVMEAKLVIALIYLNNNKYEKAIQIYKEMLAEDNVALPIKAEVYFIMGDLYKRLGDLVESKKYFIKSEEINPQQFQELKKNYKD